MAPWLAWTVLAVVSWGLWAVLSKLLGDALSPGLSQAISTLGLVPLFIPLLARQAHGLLQASPWGAALALAGGVVTSLGNVAYYTALNRGGQAAVVVTLAALAPLVTVSLGLAVLRERLTPIQAAGAAGSLLAIWLFNVPPDGALLSPAVGYAILPIVLFGLSGFLQKLATNHLDGEIAAVWYIGAFVPVGLWYAMVEPWPAVVPARSWALASSLGFFLALGNVAVLAAFARGGKAAVISPLSNLFPMVGLPLLLLLGETIGVREWIGIVVALLAAVGLAWEPPAAGDPDRICDRTDLCATDTEPVSFPARRHP